MTIDIAAFEEILPDAEAIRSAADSFKETISSVNQTAVTTAFAWNGINDDVYDVPGKEQVFSAFLPVMTAAGDLVEHTGTVHEATTAYADVVDTLKTRLEGVKADAAGFYSEVDGRPQDEWDDDEGLVEKELAIIGALDQLYADLQAAQRDCANAISGIYGGPSYVLTTEEGPAADQIAYGYSKDQLDAAAVAGDIPWGKPTEWDKPWYRDVGDGIASFGKGLWSGVTGTVTGLGNMLGVNGEEAFKQTWVGLGKLALNAAIVSSPVAQIAFRATGNSHVVDKAAEELLVVGKAAVHWDEWQSDPAYAAGATTFDLASILLTAGAGATAKVGSVAGKVATVGGKAGTVVRVTGAGRVAVGTVKATNVIQGVKVSTINIVGNAGRTAMGKANDVYQAGATAVRNTVRDGAVVLNNAADRAINAVSPQPALAGAGGGSVRTPVMNAVDTHTGSRGGAGASQGNGGADTASSGTRGGGGSTSATPSIADRTEESRRHNAGRYGAMADEQSAPARADADGVSATDTRTPVQPIDRAAADSDVAQRGSTPGAPEANGGATRTAASSVPERTEWPRTSEGAGRNDDADQPTTSNPSESSGTPSQNAPETTTATETANAPESSTGPADRTDAAVSEPSRSTTAPISERAGSAPKAAPLTSTPDGTVDSDDARSMSASQAETAPGSNTSEGSPDGQNGNTSPVASASPFAHPGGTHGTPMPDTIEKPAEHAVYGLRNDAPDAPTRLEGGARLPDEVHPDLRGIVDPDQPRYGRDENGNELTEAEYANRYGKANPQGSIVWDRYPDNAGAVDGTVRQYDNLDDLRADLGDVTVDRIGENSGDFLAVEGTPWEMRSLPVNSLGKELHHFELDDLPDGHRAEVSEIAPAFGRPGGGTQLRIIDVESGKPLNVERLVRDGALRETPRGASAARAFAAEGVPPVRDVVTVDPAAAPGPRTAFAGPGHELAPNTRYDVPGRGRFTTNDEGRIVLVETMGGTKGNLNPELQKPLPNTTYRVNDDVVYRTDDQGRTVHTRIEDYRPGDSFRSESIQRSVGRSGMEEMYPGVLRTDIEGPLRYDGGHLHGTAAGGIPERINLQPMLSWLNQGSSSKASFHAMERELMALAEGPPPKRISLDLRSRFGGGATPTSFSVRYSVDGVPQPRRSFTNS